MPFPKVFLDFEHSSKDMNLMIRFQLQVARLDKSATRYTSSTPKGTLSTLPITILAKAFVQELPRSRSAKITDGSRMRTGTIPGAHQSLPSPPTGSYHMRPRLMSGKPSSCSILSSRQAAVPFYSPYCNMGRLQQVEAAIGPSLHGTSSRTPLIIRRQSRRPSARTSRA